jgi:Na+-driven multidrug efflux pump
MKIVSYKEICKLAWPVTISQGISLINGLVDLAFISPFGTEAIAAVAIANVICTTLLNFFEGFRLGTTVLVANAAINDRQKTAGVFNTALFLAVSAGCILALAAPFISSAVFNHIASPALTTFGAPYFTYWLCVTAVSFILFTLVGFLRGLGDTITPLYIAVFICLLNAVLDYLFIYGYAGFPALGVKGSALATLAVNILGTLILFFIILRGKHTAQYLDFRQALRPFIKEYLN